MRILAPVYMKLVIIELCIIYGVSVSCDAREFVPDTTTVLKCYPQIGDDLDLTTFSIRDRVYPRDEIPSGVQVVGHSRTTVGQRVATFYLVLSRDVSGSTICCIYTTYSNVNRRGCNTLVCCTDEGVTTGASPTVRPTPTYKPSTLTTSQVHHVPTPGTTTATSIGDNKRVLIGVLVTFSVVFITVVIAGLVCCGYTYTKQNVHMCIEAPKDRESSGSPNNGVIIEESNVEACLLAQTPEAETTTPADAKTVCTLPDSNSYGKVKRRQRQTDTTRSNKVVSQEIDDDLPDATALDTAKYGSEVKEEVARDRPDSGHQTSDLDPPMTQLIVSNDAQVFCSPRPLNIQGQVLPEKRIPSGTTTEISVDAGNEEKLAQGDSTPIN